MGRSGDRKTTTPATYQHAEAFCLMTYRSDDGTEEELVWNARDGVTPFVITLRSGKQATHVDWRNDRRVPDHQPPVGSRVFVDLTPERARAAAEQRVDSYLADPVWGPRTLTQFGTRERAIEDLAELAVPAPGTPDLIEVTAEGVTSTT
ncbi:MAG: hypothetical protein JWL97_4222 [Gemmatimonadales bacterium]|nr:hypothetical protein [Gemmatimonadales bacterium]